MADGLSSIADKLVPSSPVGGMQISAITDVGAVAEALAAVFKLGDSVFEVLNSPQMLALRASQDIQSILKDEDNDLKEAQAGDKAAQARVDAESSGTQ